MLLRRCCGCSTRTFKHFVKYNYASSMFHFWLSCLGVPHGRGCNSREGPYRVSAGEPAVRVSQNRFSSQTPGEFLPSELLLCGSPRTLKSSRCRGYFSGQAFTVYFLSWSCSTAVLPYLRTSRTNLQVLHWEALRVEWLFTISTPQTRESTE